MSHPFVPSVGGIPSADIAVPEHEREVSFYSQVLTTGETPLWRDDLMNNQGTPIIGLGERIPAYEMLPLQWMPHIQVADVGASVARALELGGGELIHHKGDDGTSLWAGLLDPHGAAFGIIPVMSAESMPSDEGNPAERVGCITGFSLTVPDAPAIRDFYRQVVGWSVRDIEMEDSGEAYVDYDMLSDDGRSSTRICHARGANSGLPSVWLMHLPVGDLAESLRRVPEAGGEVVRAPRDVDRPNALAVIRDPVGVYLALVP